MLKFQRWRAGYVVGGLALFIGIFFLVNDAILLRFAEHSQGTVISYGKYKGGEYAIYQYKVGNENYQTWSSVVDDAIGSKHTILYWQKFPSNGYIEGAGAWKGFGFMVWGAIFIGASLIRGAGT